MKNFIKSIIKHLSKNLYNNINTKKMLDNMAEVSEKRYQWKKGERFGEVVTVDNEDSDFLNFTDGSRIYKSVAREYLEEVIEGSLPLPGADKINFEQGIMPQPVSSPTVQPKVHPAMQTTTPPVIEEERSYLFSLIEKLSRKNIAPLETTINLNIPGKDVFNMLVENADEDRAELISTISTVALEQIEINKLQEYLTEEITKYLNNYYNE